MRYFDTHVSLACDRGPPPLAYEGLLGSRLTGSVEMRRQYQINMEKPRSVIVVGEYLAVALCSTTLANYCQVPELVESQAQHASQKLDFE